MPTHTALDYEGSIERARRRRMDIDRVYGRNRLRRAWQAVKDALRRLGDIRVGGDDELP